MDGLMIDTENLAQRSLYEYVGPLIGVEFAPGELLGLIGKNRAALNEWWAEEIQPKYGINEDWQEISRLSYEWQKSYIMEYGLEPKKGLVELLEWLKANNIPCAVATSTDESRVELRLGEHGAGVLQYFQTVVCGNMVSKSKPDPETFIKAMEALGFDKPSEGVVFEDSALGIKAGVDGGFNTVVVPDIAPLDKNYVNKCIAKLDSLDQAIEVLTDKLA